MIPEQAFSGAALGPCTGWTGRFRPEAADRNPRLLAPA